MVSIRASSIDVFRYMRTPHCACAKSTFPHSQGKSVMPSGGDSGGNWIFLTIKHVLRHVNMFLFLNQNLGVVYLSVCMCMLSTCLSCIDASLLLSIGIEKSIISTVSKVKYSVSYRAENTWYRPPLHNTHYGVPRRSF